MDPGATTIAALATPPGTGAVALLRISGPRAVAVASASFRGRDSGDWIPRTQHWGRIVDGSGVSIDEVLLTFFPGPASFTGEDVVEISTHGGIVVANRVLERILDCGAEAAEPGEFSRRAFFNGRIDLTQAEAIMDLISAQTELAARAAAEQLAGSLGDEFERIRKDLVGLIAHVEAFIDFPEEDIDPDSDAALQERCVSIERSMEELLATADQGRILREGMRTVICGAPNAGKSSLLNLLLGFDRAIVNASAGTTRDTIEEVVSLRGIPLRLVDTAGIREATGEVEREGIERSRKQLESADLVLHVVDSSESREVTGLIQLPDRAHIVTILNKTDLPSHEDWAEAEGLRISCLEASSADELRDYLYREITEREINTTSLLAINRRHQRCLTEAKESLAKARNLLAEGESPEFPAIDLRSSLDSIGKVIGKTDVEEILGEIFSTFCIGK